ncbi:hypothetical protein NKR19_g6656 [Coniochaeta hoffmannii]|uniref:DUF1772-domain-containing protein n=1 Tax=Coniochaeta hoffmannii TaxID=91930 RepID=A0AA38VPJ2_9PEZI|nr:hypothetical protein NKR19_g6656 [Coniochaeta hoffmannii]
MGLASQAIVGLTIAFSYTLFGNAVTQSFMGVPALLIDFPPPTSPSHAAAARHLGRQWPVFWAVGNVFFRPISTLGIFGYAFTAYSAFTTSSFSPGVSHAYATRRGRGAAPGDWRLYAISAACHLVTVVHSAVNMQPINARIDGLRNEGVSTAELEKAEYWARRWARLNLVRLVMPLVAGSLALSQVLRA